MSCTTFFISCTAFFQFYIRTVTVSPDADRKYLQSLKIKHHRQEAALCAPKLTQGCLFFISSYVFFPQFPCKLVHKNPNVHGYKCFVTGTTRETIVEKALIRDRYILIGLDFLVWLAKTLLKEVEVKLML